MKGFYPSAGKSQTVAWALGLTVCYQVIYQSFMLVWLESQEHTAAEAESRATVAKLPFAQCDGRQSSINSSVCAEVAMFRRWREEELEISWGSAVHASESGADFAGLPVERNAQTSPTLAPRSIATTTSASNSSARMSSERAEFQHESWWDRAQRWQSFDKLYNETLAAIRAPRSLSPWAKQLIALQAKLSVSPTAEPTPIIKTEAPLTPWAVDLVALQTHLEEGMERSRLRHSRTSRRLPHAPEPLTAKIRSFGEELCKSPHRRNYSACASFLASGVNSSEHSLPSDVHRSRWHVFKTYEASGETREPAASEPNQADWQHDFARRVAEYGRELCSDPGRLNYTACAKFLPPAVDSGKSSLTLALDNATAEVGNDTQPYASLRKLRSQPNLRGTDLYLRRLHWSDAVKAMSLDGVRSNRRVELSNYQMQQLRLQKWQGMIPKVSCITAVPSGAASAFRLKYFLDNFKLQTYEGPRQLVLLYKRSDTKIGELIQAHVDGNYIKAAALPDALTENGSFPSTAVLRYGAWLADANVIAHWSFDEWHHPERLSWQVRALALTGRPVSLFEPSIVQRKVDNLTSPIVVGVALLETSFVGEASWVQQHWMPYLGVAYRARDIVQVNIPELSAYSAEGSSGWEIVLDRFHSQDMGVACTNLTSASSSLHSTNRSDLAAMIGQTIGTEFVNTFRELTQKHKEILQSLYSLCREAEAEPKGHRRSELFAQASHVESIHRSIITHFDGLEALFEKTSNLNS